MEWIYQYTDPIRDAIYEFFKWAGIVGFLIAVSLWHLRNALSGKLPSRPPTESYYDRVAREDDTIRRQTQAWEEAQRRLDKERRYNSW